MRICWAILLFCAAVYGQSRQDKECADQAAKVMASKTPNADEAIDWNNHYSPKYDKCFIEIRTLLKFKGVVSRWLATELEDAFERKRMAYLILGNSCTINGDAEDCSKVQNFIAEHMNN